MNTSASNKDIKLIAEAYDQVSKFIPLTPDRAKYILFSDDMEVYQIKPYRKLDDARFALNDKTVKNWSYREIIIGEDIQTEYPNANVDSTLWYIVPTGSRLDNKSTKVLVGYIASL
jgi:hypothetical protein